MVEPGSDNDSDFLSAVLTPGSSLNPTFLLLVDGVLALLALTLISLIIVSGGSVHPIALLLIELALWVSIKWFVNELQKTELAHTSSPQSSETKKTL
ncbi:hypothetical protein BJY52DRAFT_1182707 [Lactarius psammicola]|nr:hypothetical protein BJY52DRAFT_1197319 [Lactarius psammicola]KAI9467263.1 hypothetical protein BJY52DRAFT_1182707 [Lactarius psammicola]